MHRIDYDGYTTEDGKRRFIDQAEPGTPGTILGAQWMNAVQEEIAGVVVRAGLTLAATPAADRTAGWFQLHTAIFASKAIDTAALADGAVTDDKLAADAVTDDKLATGQDLSKFNHGVLSMTVAASGATTQRKLSIERNEQWLIADGVCGRCTSIIEDITNGGSATYYDCVPVPGGSYIRATDIRPDGIRFCDDTNNSGGGYTDAIKIRNISMGKTWWVEGPGGRFCKSVISTIPKTRKIFGASPLLEQPDLGVGYDGISYIVHPPQVHLIRFYRAADSAFWKITCEALIDVSNYDSLNDVKIMVTYAGS